MGKVLFLVNDSTTGIANDYYFPIGGNSIGGAPETTEANIQTLVRNAGTLSKLLTNFNNQGGDPVTLRSRKNGANGNLTVSYSTSETGVKEDTSNSDTIAAGDKINYFLDCGATVAYGFNFISTIYDATTNTSQLLTLVGSTNVTTASTTWYGALNGGNTAAQTTEASVKFRIRKSETLAKLGVYVSANARTTNTIFKSRKNGADGALTLTFGSTVTGWLEDTSNSDTLVAGNDANYAYVTSTGTQTLTYKIIKSEAVSTSGDSPLIEAKNTVTTQAEPLTRYYNVSSILTAQTTESTCRVKVREAFTISELNILLTLNGITSASTLTLRKSGAAGNNTVSITASTAGLFNDTTHTDVLTSTSEICYQLVTPAVSGTPTLSMAWISCNANLVASTNYDRPLSAETISVSESIARLYGSNRAPTAETNTIGEAIARVATNTRALGAETNTIGESLAKVFGVNRALSTETNTIGESLARLYGANRALSDSPAISEAIAKVQVLVRALSTETTTIGESLVRIFGVVRTSSDTVVIGESLARIYNAIRALSTQTTTIGETLTRLYSANRALSTETITVGESLTRVLGAIRSLSTETTVIGESLTRVYGAIRALATQTTTISESLARVYGAVRSLSDTTVISESLARLLESIRALSDTTTESGTVATEYTPVGGGAINYNRPLSAETVDISESLARAVANVRSLSDTIAISESLTRLQALTKSLTDTTIISESLSRLQALTRTLTDTTVITGTVARTFGITKSLIETVIISETLARIQTLIRTLTETTVISTLLTRMQSVTRELSDSVIINETLETLKKIFEVITIPLYLQSTQRKIESGFNRFMQRSRFRESESYVRQLGNKAVRKYLIRSRKAG